VSGGCECEDKISTLAYAHTNRKVRYYATDTALLRSIRRRSHLSHLLLRAQIDLHTHTHTLCTQPTYKSYSRSAAPNAKRKKPRPPANPSPCAPGPPPSAVLPPARHSLRGAGAHDDERPSRILASHGRGHGATHLLPEPRGDARARADSRQVSTPSRAKSQIIGITSDYRRTYWAARMTRLSS
jgi:hypothetical protein